MTPAPLRSALLDWFTARIPADWFTGPPRLWVDDDEILLVGEIPEPPDEADTTGATRDAERVASLKAFREATRDLRIEIASEAEHRFARKVSWGARCGDAEQIFTSLAVPVMTRLRLPERTLLDTLVDAGVARSRSEALAWCVRLVGSHESDWLADLEEALASVRRVRADGPRSI